jgi:hypothetical protein
MPYEAVAWHGWVKRATGATPSWRGHIHDGISARKLSDGYVGRNDIPYDGSLGVLLHPEDDENLDATYLPYTIHPFGFSAGTPSRADSQGILRGYMLTGKFGFAPGTGGSSTFDSTYKDEAMPYTRRAMAAVPFDPSELSGPLLCPVVVGTLRAEMDAGSLPDREIPFRSTDTVEQKYWGMDIFNIQLFPMTGSGRVGGSDPHLRGYMLLFEMVLPGPDHPISQGVARWWVDWIMLAKLGESVPPIPEVS